MREWMRRNGLDVFMMIVLGFALVGVWLNIETAGAQKPAQQPAISHQKESSGLYWTNHGQPGEAIFKIYKDGHWDFAPEFWKMVEQHCVAVLPALNKEGINIRRQDLKLRCTPDKEQK